MKGEPKPPISSYEATIVIFSKEKPMRDRMSRTAVVQGRTFSRYWVWCLK